MNNEIELLERKEAAIVACIDALAPLNQQNDLMISEKEILIEALQEISEYPALYKLKNRVNKIKTPDYNASLAQSILRLAISGEAMPNDLIRLNEALENAYHSLREQLEQRKKTSL